MDELFLSKVLIEMNDPDDHDLINEITEELKFALHDQFKIELLYETKQTTQKATNLLDLVFYVIIAIMMFLCFFALQASMTTIIYDQTKEIAILRSIGFTSLRITMLYFYEAFLLVISASLMGVCIGVLVGFTMVLQQDLFLN